MPAARRCRAVPWRRAARLGAALVLLLGSFAAASAEATRVPKFRYYRLARTDDRPHAIKARVVYAGEHLGSSVVDFVTQTTRGRTDVFDFGYVGSGNFADVSAGGTSTPDCDGLGACPVPFLGEGTLSVSFPVRFDYYFVARDATVDVDLSMSPDKNWVFKELTGDPRVTGRAHVLMPEDGDAVNVSVLGVAAQRVREISHPGGVHGSIAMALVPDPLHDNVGSVGSAQLDGGRAYVQDIRRVGGSQYYSIGSAGASTTWRLHGDVTTVGFRRFVSLLVYDLPDPKALRAFMKRR